MDTYIKQNSLWGETLYIKHGKLTLGIPLCFGIRISYVSYDESENLFFEQPTSMTDLTTDKGWRVRGGHRLWVAPEGEQTYYPDNEKISYELTENGVILHQKNDPWISMEKTVEISFVSENSLKVIHTIKNTSDKECRCALWAVTSVDAGGIEYIPLTVSEGSSAPVCRFSTWFHTSLGDKRVNYRRESITINHSPTSERYKIGIGHPAGPVTYTNKGVVFEKSYEVISNVSYPDGDVSYETFLCDHMVEIESLSPLYNIQPQETATHIEMWKFLKSETD